MKIWGPYYDKDKLLGKRLSSRGASVHFEIDKLWYIMYNDFSE